MTIPQQTPTNSGIQEMTRLVIPLPKDVYLFLQSRGLPRELLTEEARRALAVRLFQTKALSLGRSAKVAGLGIWDFIDLLGERGIPVVDYGDEELATEFETVNELAGELGP
jgi:predicted HTH domain antitoxin